jgi:hypothetical protein
LHQMGFDYNRSAALFMKSPTGRGPPLGYRRFWSAAEAIRFAVQDLPVTGMQVWLEVGNEQVSEDRIRQLYDSADYPLPRRSP